MGIMQKILDRVFPRPEAGNACREAAFDPDLMPDALREKVALARRQGDGECTEHQAGQGGLVKESK